MTYEIDVADEWGVEAALVDELETAVATTLRLQNIPLPAMLTLLLTDDAAIQQLNWRFRDEDKPTDVLSFPAGEPLPGETSDGGAPYLGDIAISVPYAARQAATADHSLSAELQLLAVHGVLHLLGYDHLEPDEKQQMWSVQTAVLAALGLSDITPTET